MKYKADKGIWETETTGTTIGTVGTAANTDTWIECGQYEHKPFTWPTIDYPKEVFRFDLNGKTVKFMQYGNGKISVEGVDPFELTTEEFEKIKEEIALFKMK